MARTRTVRRLVVAGITAALVLVPVGSAFACGALLAPNGTISLTRTTTLAAYHNGIEHYLTEFTFNGSGSKFGSIVPLPARPTKVIQAGRWTLQRLELEDNPPNLEFAALASDVAAPNRFSGGSSRTIEATPPSRSSRTGGAITPPSGSGRRPLRSRRARHRAGSRAASAGRRRSGG